MLIATTLLLALAQQEDASLRAALEVAGLTTGGRLQATLRSTELGQPARIVFGPPAVRPLAPPHGILLVDLAHARSFSGLIGLDGTFRVDAPLPAGAVAGRLIAVQGGVQARSGQILLSWSRTLVGDASQRATFNAGPAALPPAALTQVSGSVEPVDYDRDGDLDLTIATLAGPTGTPGGLQFFTNLGGGNLSDETAARISLAENEACFGHQAADFNADGHADLVVFGREDAAGVALEPVILFNDGAGAFGGAAGHADLDTGLGAALDVAIGDVDLDGDLDLAFCDGAQHNPSKGPQTLALMRNQGGTWARDAQFQAAIFNNDLWTSSCLALGDVDGDGDLDLAVGRTSGIGADDMLLINDGAGRFADESATRLPNYLDKTSDLKFADLNGDGWLDLLFAQSHVSTDPLFTSDLLYNQGPAQPGVFVDAPPSAWPETADPELLLRLWVETGDVDLDGDLDVLVLPHEFFQPSGAVGGYPGLFLNLGGAQGGTLGTFAKDPGFFRSGGAPFADFISGGGALFDLDGDGDLDFYVSSQGGIFVPTNTQDHLLRNALR